MLKICGETINQHSELIFKWPLITNTYRPDCKKSNIVPVHKKGDRQNIKSYRPVSLQYAAKFLKGFYLIIFLVFLEHNLITQSQSGFKPADSCINQLLSIAHEIHKSFDDGFEERSVF